MTKLVIFDLDGTLTESKSDMDAEMSRLLCSLLAKKPVAVIGGGRYELFQKQLLARLRCPRERLQRLYLFPTTSTACYRYGKKGWRRVYAHVLPRGARRRIVRAFENVLRELKYVPPAKTYGKVIEDRGTQVTFSALGQDVVKALGARGVRLKKEWQEKNAALKMKITRRLKRALPGLEVRAAGYTSIDVTRKGIDKAYGIRQIRKHLKVAVRDMLFVGDALFPGGNDYAARRTGVRCVQVSGPKATKKLIRSLLRE